MGAANLLLVIRLATSNLELRNVATSRAELKKAAGANLGLYQWVACCVGCGEYRPAE